MTSVKALVEDLLGERSLSPEEAADRHYAPHFRQRTDGVWADRAAVLASLAELRKATTDVRITVLDELSDGRNYAERHVVALSMVDGTVVRREVYVFGRLDEDGRFESIEELTRPLPANEAEEGAA